MVILQTGEEPLHFIGRQYQLLNAKWSAHASNTRPVVHLRESQQKLVGWSTTSSAYGSLHVSNGSQQDSIRFLVISELFIYHPSTHMRSTSMGAWSEVPLVSLFFCLKLPLLGAAPFRWSFVAGPGTQKIARGTSCCRCSSDPKLPLQATVFRPPNC